MNKNNTPFGFVPDEYLSRVCALGGIKWDEGIKNYIVLAELKEGKKYRNAHQLAGILTEGKQKHYAITPRFEVMSNYAKTNGANWYKEIVWGLPEEEAVQEIRTKKLAVRSIKQSEYFFNED